MFRVAHLLKIADVWGNNWILLHDTAFSALHLTYEYVLHCDSFWVTSRHLDYCDSSFEMTHKMTSSNVSSQGRDTGVHVYSEAKYFEGDNIR